MARKLFRLYYHVYVIFDEHKEINRKNISRSAPDCVDIAYLHLLLGRHIYLCTVKYLQRRYGPAYPLEGSFLIPLSPDSQTIMIRGHSLLSRNLILLLIGAISKGHTIYSFTSIWGLCHKNYYCKCLSHIPQTYLPNLDYLTPLPQMRGTGELSNRE